MKIAIVLALAITTSPAMAKIWVDETCQVMLESAPDKPFIYSTTDGSRETACTVKDWPISEETATMACVDGSAPTMKIVGEAIEFDGTLLLPKGDAAILCD